MSMASIIILAVVFVLDVLAFVLAIGAEKRRNTAAYVNVDQNARPYCVYGSDAATGYGIGALVLLAAGQAVIMVATRCFCCGRALSPGRWRAFAGFCFITCWFTFVIAELCLLAGSVRNAYHTKYSTLVIRGPPHCAMLRKGVFAAGAAFTFLTALFAELHYLFFAKARHAAAVPPPIVGGIGMTRM
uniref:Fiber protein Fb34 n=1 Tax=Oryza glumipatula TaxID=40148 RepID=A0A0D9ZSH5_9ORYZ